MATKLISVRINEATLGQLELERCNGLKANRIINQGTAMFIDLMDTVRSIKAYQLDRRQELDLFLNRWVPYIYGLTGSRGSVPGNS